MGMLHSETRAIDDLVFEIFRLSDRLELVGDDAVKDFGLTNARWRVLGAIAVSPAPMTVAQIARMMGLSRQAVQRLANEMSTTGLVELQDNPSDRRARIVALTGRGRESYDAVMKRWRAEWTAPMEEILTDDEIVDTLRCLRRLRALMQTTANVRAWSP